MTEQETNDTKFLLEMKKFRKDAENKLLKMKEAHEYVKKINKAFLQIQRENTYPETRLLDRIDMKYNIKLDYKTDQDLFDKLNKDGLGSLVELLKMTI